MNESKTCKNLGYACGEYFCNIDKGNKDSFREEYSFPDSLCKNCKEKKLPKGAIYFYSHLDEDREKALEIILEGFGIEYKVFRMNIIKNSVYKTKKSLKIEK